MNWAIGIAEVFMERRKMDDFKGVPEYTHHSMDFYLNIDYLIQLKMIKFLKWDEVDLYFSSMITDETLNVLMESLMF